MDKLKQVLSRKDLLRRAEAMCSALESEESGRIALVPGIANFQLPEVFLSTKILPECETYFIQESQEISETETEEWNRRIEETIEEMSGEFVISHTVHNKPPIDELEIEEIVKRILGYDEVPE